MGDDYQSSDTHDSGTKESDWSEDGEFSDEYGELMSPTQFGHSQMEADDQSIRVGKFLGGSPLSSPKKQSSRRNLESHQMSYSMGQMSVIGELFNPLRFIALRLKEHREEELFHIKKE